MRRVAIPVLTALLAASFAPFVASAADSTVVVHGRTGFPSDDSVGESLVGCDDYVDRGNQVPLLYVGYTDPVPLGHIYWGFTPVGVNEAFGFYFDVPHIATTTVAGLTFDSEGSASGVAYVFYVPSGTTDGTFWVGRAALSATDVGWQDLDVAGLTYSWKERDPAANGGTGGYVADGGSALIPAFVAAHGADGEAIITLGFGCNGNRTWYDGLRVGSPGNVTTYDLDREASVTTIAPPAASITAGGSVTITGGVHPAGRSVDYGNAPLHLEAKKAGDPDFVEVGASSTGVDNEPASLVLEPTIATEYRWRFDGALSIDPSVSPTIKVQVRTAVTSVIADKTLKPGQTLVVKGRTTPKKPGVAATLWRKTATGKAKLSTATIKADGTFRLTKGLKTKGVWKVFVTVPASSGNLAGTSPIRKATVR